MGHELRGRLLVDQCRCLFTCRLAELLRPLTAPADGNTIAPKGTPLLVSFFDSNKIQQVVPYITAIMRLLRCAAWAAWTAFVLAAKKGSKTGFELRHSEFLASPPLTLDDALYDELTVTPRNYTVVTLLTAGEARFGCQLCKEFQKVSHMRSSRGHSYSTR